MSRLCRRLARCPPQFGGLLAWRGSANVPGETVFVVVVVFLLLLVIGNIVFSFMAERKNPPIGTSSSVKNPPIGTSSSVKGASPLPRAWSSRSSPAWSCSMATA